MLVGRFLRHVRVLASSHRERIVVNGSWAGGWALLSEQHTAGGTLISCHLPLQDGHLGPRTDPPVLSRVSRSGLVESWHRGSVVVVHRGEVVFALGDPDQYVCARSAVKPFQALPLIERGVAARLGLTSAELALTASSHNGTPEQTALAKQILARGGFGQEDLLLGPHSPFDQKASIAIAAAGAKPQKIHNNCSGKHAGFLLLARDMEAEPEGYLEPDSEPQALIRRTVAEMTEIPEAQIHVGIDGCGAPALGLPLHNLARGFANLTNPAPLGDVRREACTLLRTAIADNPSIYAGVGRLCTALIQALPGIIYPKNGAEGVYAFGLAGRETGVAIKVDDGATRGYLPVVVDLLGNLGLWDEIPEVLREFCPRVVRNTQGLRVGEVSCTVSWPTALTT